MKKILTVIIDLGYNSKCSTSRPLKMLFSSLRMSWLVYSVPRSGVLAWKPLQAHPNTQLIKLFPLCAALSTAVIIAVTLLDWPPGVLGLIFLCCLQDLARGLRTPQTMLSGSLPEFQISFSSDEQGLD